MRRGAARCGAVWCASRLDKVLRVSGLLDARLVLGRVDLEERKLQQTRRLPSQHERSVGGGFGGSSAALARQARQAVAHDD